MTIKTVFVDFGNVIAPFSHMKAATHIAELCTNSVTPQQVYGGIWGSGLEASFDCGSPPTEEFLNRLRSEFSISARDEDLKLAWNDIFDRNESVIQAIKRLPRNTRLILASNTNALHFNYFRPKFADVLDLFDDFVLSYEVGARKPDTRFFDRCLELANCDSLECLFIDDMPQYVAAAQQFGMRGIVYRPDMRLDSALADEGAAMYVEPDWAQIDLVDYADLWDKLAGPFEPTQPRSVAVGSIDFLVVEPSPGMQGVLPVYCDAPGLSFLAKPRLKSYRHRFVLVPRETPAGDPRSEIKLGDVADWAAWCKQTRQIIFYSTFKSGASEPFKQHAQSVPFRQSMPDGTDLILTALREEATLGECLVDFGKMPTFERLKISVIGKYPVSGIRIDFRSMTEGRWQLDRKVYELAGSWNAFRAFNVVLVPCENDPNDTPICYFFPRKRRGQAIYLHMDGEEIRWQVAALELSGLIQPRTKRFAAEMDSGDIVDLFAKTTCDADEFRDFLELIKAF